MDDDSSRKRDWAIIFVSRLCLISWVSAILYETFDFLPPVRQMCLFFGPWACVIALLNSLVFLLIRRQGVFFVFALITIPPSIEFGYVLKNIVVEKRWFATDKSVKSTETDAKETSSEGKPSR
jgi:hypothetical protein